MTKIKSFGIFLLSLISAKRYQKVLKCFLLAKDRYPRVQSKTNKKIYIRLAFVIKNNYKISTQLENIKNYEK